MIANASARETAINNDSIGGNGGGGRRGTGKKSSKDAQKQLPEKSDNYASATLEMSKVNNTLNTFVGGKMKTWMWNNNTIPTPGGIAVPTTIRSQAGPIKRKTTPLNKQRSTNSAEGLPVRRSSTTINDDPPLTPLLATVGPGKSPPFTAPSSLSPDLRGSGLPPKRRTPTETVLPSPAPSDTSAADRREDEDEVVTPVAARDTSIASPTFLNDNSDNQRYGERRDERVAAVDTRMDQTELSSGINGEVSGDAAVVERGVGDQGQQQQPRHQQLQRASTKRGLDTADENPESGKRQKPSPLLPLTDRADIDSLSSVPRVEHDLGTGLSNRVQSPVIIDSRQASPACPQPNVRPPPIPQSISFNGPRVAGTLHTPLGPLQSLRIPGAGNPLPLLYSTSLPPATPTAPAIQSPMLANTPSYPSPNVLPSNHSPNQSSRYTQEVQPSYQSSIISTPEVVRNQQQQQLLQEQSRNRRPPPQEFHPAKLTSHLPRYDQFIHTEGGAGLRQFNSVECFRFRVLREAITKDDWWFTILNQVYAMMSTAAEVLYRETQITPGLPGFQALPDILHENQRLSGRNLAYLADFPMPIAEAKQRFPFFQELLVDVKDFLSTGYKVIANMKQFYFNQGKVPTLDDIEQDIRSPVFRHIFIRYLQHHVAKMLEASSQMRNLEQQQLLQEQQRQQLYQQHQQHRQQQRQAQQEQQAARVMVQQLRQNLPQPPPPPQALPSQSISPTQAQSFQTDMANYQQRPSASQQYQQMAMNAQALNQVSPSTVPQYATFPAVPVTRPSGGLMQSDQTNREYLQRVQSSTQGQLQQSQPQPLRPVPQRVISQTQQLPSSSNRRGNNVGLSIDTERAQQQQQMFARYFEHSNNRNYQYPPGVGSANTSPMPTPTSLPMASPQYGGTSAMQQQLNGSASRRNMQAQIQRQTQLRPSDTVRRVPSTPVQQTFSAPPPPQPVRRQSYTTTQSHPMMVSDAVLSAHAQANWPPIPNNVLMSNQPMSPMSGQAQPMQQQQTHQPQQQQLQQGPPQSGHPNLVLFSNGLPRQQNGVAPIPMPIRASYAGLPQHILQSHLMSPRFTEPPQVDGRPPPRSKLYISITGFAFPGVVIDFQQPCQKVKFNVGEDTEKRLSKMRLGSKPGDGLTRPMVVPGSLIYRLRAIKWTKNVVSETPDKDWVGQETDWPSNTFIEVNGNRIELRRKPAWGKDLPADITTHIKAGENEIKIAVLRTRQMNPATPVYAIAVEVHECLHEDSIVAGLTHIDSAGARTLITGRLVTKDDGDDLMVVDSDELSLPVTCPLSFTLINTPVRAKSCPHLECFDFKNFLDSRPRRKEWEPPNSDAWRCPICRGDARPGELIIDGFLEDVLKTLREKDAGVDDPRHIVVKKDGAWEVKNEKENTGCEREERKDSNASGISGGTSKKEVEVICLDDDDD